MDDTPIPKELIHRAVAGAVARQIERQNRGELFDPEMFEADVEANIAELSQAAQAERFEAQLAGIAAFKAAAREYWEDR